MNIHRGKYKCTECGKCCRSSHDLAKHRRSHSGEKPFECTVCSKRFTQAGQLVVHSRIHCGEKPYQCSLCGKCFSDSSTLQRHKRSVHGNSGQYLCPPVQSKCGFNPLSTIPCVLSLMMLYLVAVLLCQPVSNC